jgi:hypothetical protein
MGVEGGHDPRVIGCLNHHDPRIGHFDFGHDPVAPLEQDVERRALDEDLGIAPLFNLIDNAGHVAGDHPHQLSSPIRHRSAFSLDVICIPA